MIKLINVNKYFNHHKKNQIHVINDTTLELKENGLVALLGPSGCGKTTLLNTIGGLDRINNGKIFVNEKLISRRNYNKIDQIRNLNVGYIFQDFHLIDDKSVFDNVALVLQMIGLKDKKIIKERVDYVLETVGIYRYRNRPAGMLSGGERQRVGIARAIVKNPNIILADEPTGNLDSRNTIEIMNIIKSISKNKLVLLVTHEKDIAHFYASHIIEMKDGKVEKDYLNEQQDDLDYHMENKIYLKDFPQQDKHDTSNYVINYYGNNNEKINLDIVVKNQNIYIKSMTDKKIEVIDNNSNIEFINDNYKKINKSDYEKYDFDMAKLDNSEFKLKYSSIFNIFTLLINGFQKIFNYAFLKKLLLIGFFLSGMFIFYSLSNIYGILDIKDEDFVTQNQNNLLIRDPNVLVDKYLQYEANPLVQYVLPGDESMVSIKIDFYGYNQTKYASDFISGSLSSLENIKKENLLIGKMPNNKYEIIIDKMIIKSLFKNYIAQQAGYTKNEDFLNHEIKISNMPNFTIVGIVDLLSPSIYTDPSLFINVMANDNQENGGNWFIDDRAYDTVVPDYPSENQYLDYELKTNEIKLKRGKYPIKDYEVMVNYDESMIYPLNKLIDETVNGKKLRVVGYYTTTTANFNTKLVNNNTIKYNLITKSNDVIIYPRNKKLLIKEFNTNKINIHETYLDARNEYIKSNQEQMTATIVLASIILGISFIEIFLIIRSSFLSRIKEIGILRAIGVMKADIYKMFLGEILAITVLASVPGYIFMIYIVDRLTNIRFFAGNYLINTNVVVLGLLLIFIFNIFVGLLPVYNTIKKTPASILSRNDVN